MIEGYTTSTVSYEIIDPNEIKDGHVYYITFEDTVKAGTEDTLTTKNFSLYDSTANVIVIDKSTRILVLMTKVRLLMDLNYPL